jgi:protein ImuA
VGALLPGAAEGSLRLHRLLTRGLHRIEAAHADRPAAAGFSLALLPPRPERAVLWAFPPQAEREWGSPFGPGLMRLGWNPGNFVFIRTRREQEVPWALEEGVRSGAIVAAVGEGSLSFTAQRRLALLAAEQGTLVLLVTGEDAATRGSPAAARWRVRASASRGDPLDPAAPGPPSWQVDLLRSRTGPPASWIVEWDRATGAMRLAAGMAPRAAAAGGLSAVG